MRHHFDLGSFYSLEAAAPSGLLAAAASSWPPVLIILTALPFPLPLRDHKGPFADFNDSFKDLRVKLAAQRRRDSTTSTSLLAWKLSQELCLTIGDIEIKYKDTALRI